MILQEKAASTVAHVQKRKYTYHGVERLGHTAVGVPIYRMTKRSMGEEGTIENIRDHAQAIKPFVDQMLEVMHGLDATKWIQGNNVHVVFSLKGTEYRWRAMKRNKVYYGIQCLRVSKDNKRVRVLKVTDMTELENAVTRWTTLLATT